MICNKKINDAILLINPKPTEKSQYSCINFINSVIRFAEIHFFNFYISFIDSRKHDKLPYIDDQENPQRPPEQTTPSVKESSQTVAAKSGELC